MFLTLTLFLLFTALFSLIILKWKFFKITGVKKVTLYTGFFGKIIAGSLMIYLYSGFYGDTKNNDVYKYYQDSEPIYESLFTDSKTFINIFFLNKEDEQTRKVLQNTENWDHSNTINLINDNRNIIRINVVLRLLTFGGNIWLHMLLMSFLTFFACIWFFKSFEKYTQYKNIFFLIICLFPSAAFWSSPVMKESIVFIALAAMIYSSYLYVNNGSKRQMILLFIISITLLILIKIYVLLALIPGLILLLTNKFITIKPKHLLLYYALIFAGTIFMDITPLEKLKIQRDNFSKLAEGGIYFYDSNYMYFVRDEDRKALTIDNNQVNVLSRSKALKSPINQSSDTSSVWLPVDSSVYQLYFNQRRAGSYIPIPELEANTLSILSKTPHALANASLRPYPHEIDNVTSLFSFVELVLVLFTVILSILLYNKQTKLPFIHKHLCFSFILLIIILVGLTTPVSGAIVRYRMPAFYLLTIVAFVHIDFEKIKLLQKK